MAPRTNRDILTQGKNYANKQSKKFGAVEVTFDKDSRLEYLTGFHKRKLQRQKKAQEFSKEQDRQAKIEARKTTREQRKKESEEQLRKFKESMKDVGDYIGSGEESEEEEEDEKVEKKEDENISEEVESWQGFSEAEDEDDKEVKPILKKSEQIYEDETHVDIEPLEPNDNFEYLAKVNNVKLDRSKMVLDESIERAKKYAKFLGMDEKPKKKKKFRYLTKAERRQNQRKAESNKRRR